MYSFRFELELGDGPHILSAQADNLATARQKVREQLDEMRRKDRINSLVYMEGCIYVGRMEPHIKRITDGPDSICVGR